MVSEVRVYYPIHCILYIPYLVHIREEKVLTAAEDEEQMIMRRLRNSVDELRRGYR